MDGMTNGKINPDMVCKNLWNWIHDAAVQETIFEVVILKALFLRMYDKWSRNLGLYPWSIPLVNFFIDGNAEKAHSILTNLAGRTSIIFET